VPLADLRNLWRVGFILRDDNGDEVVDGVDVSFLMRETASAAEIIAAANIAARAGFETTAIDLPVARGCEANTVVVLGLDALREPEHGDIRRRAVAPPAGLGLITLHSNSATGKALILLQGSDDEALLGCARFLSELSQEDIVAINRRVAGVEESLKASGSLPREVRVCAALVTHEGRLTAFDLTLAALTSLSGSPLAPRGADTPYEILPADIEGVSRLRVEWGAHLPTSEYPHNIETLSNGGRVRTQGDLASFYGAGGCFAPPAAKRLAGLEDVVISPFGEGIEPTIDLAARLALEATSIRLPLVVPAEALRASLDGNTGDPRSRRGTLILIGAEHLLVRVLKQRGVLRPMDDTAGRGAIELLSHSFERADAPINTIVVRATEADALKGALARLALVTPHIGARGKDRPVIGDVALELAEVVNATAPLGQAVSALCLLEEIALALPPVGLEEVEAEVAVDRADPGLSVFLNEWARTRFGPVRTTARVLSRDVRQPVAVADLESIGCEFIVRSEITEFWTLLRGQVLDHMGKGDDGFVEIDAYLSESPETRSALAVKVRDALSAKGITADRLRVTIGCAYKPGFSWITEVVSDALAPLGVDRVTFQARRHRPPIEWPHQTIFTPTRWLHELYPADVMLARRLGVPLETIGLKVVDEAPETYEVIAWRGGTEVYRCGFSPRLIVQPLIHHFPDYERVQVTTGGLRASVGGHVICDQRIETDIERLWRHFQSETLPRLHDYIMRVTSGDPRPGDAPLFAELRIEANLSEPDYRSGVADEVVSSIDALHEEIYFGTRRFLEVMGQRLGGAPLEFPGRIIPVLRASAPNEPQRCKISFAGFAAVRPHARLRWRTRWDTHEKVIPIPQRAVPKPRVVDIRTDCKLPERCELTVEFVTDERGEEKERLRNSAYFPSKELAESLISIGQLQRVCDWVGRLKLAGLYPTALAYEGLHAVRVTSDCNPLAAIPLACGRSIVPDIRSCKRTAAQDGLLFRSEAPITPDVANATLAEMARFDEVTAYRVGESYLGRDIWAIDLMEPVAAGYLSRLKLTTAKPTIVFSARQHANEVSSTHFVLDLAQRLLTDPDRRRLLRRVNVVVQPMQNPDGAALVEELRALSPNLLLHAGYFGALGGDVGYGFPGDRSIMPESKVRPRLWEWWLPDIFMNPHGQPGHEWVAPFSEYVGWAISRTKVVRSFWAPRGWFVPDATYIVGPDYLEHRHATFEILTRIIAAQKADAAAVERTEFLRALYTRYTVDIDPDTFGLNVVDGTTVCFKSPLGERPYSASVTQHWMLNHPDITIWQGSTEAVDEVAYGESLRSAAGEGLRWGMAVIEYLAQARHEVRRSQVRDPWGTIFSVHRRRPGTSREDGGALAGSPAADRHRKLARLLFDPERP
jgi:zinc carboxypeptidase